MEWGNWRAMRGDWDNKGAYSIESSGHTMLEDGNDLTCDRHSARAEFSKMLVAVQRSTAWMAPGCGGTA